MSLLGTVKAILNNKFFSFNKCDVCGKVLTDQQVDTCDSPNCCYEYYVAEDKASAIPFDDGLFNEWDKLKYY